MDQAFGITLAAVHAAPELRRAARWLVLIEAGGGASARLYLDSHEQVAEFDAATEELVSMTRGLVPQHGACGPEWDRALAGFGDAERAAAEVYQLSV